MIEGSNSNDNTEWTVSSSARRAARLMSTTLARMVYETFFVMLCLNLVNGSVDQPFIHGFGNFFWAAFGIAGLLETARWTYDDEALTPRRR